MKKQNFLILFLLPKGTDKMQCIAKASSVTNNSNPSHDIPDLVWPQQPHHTCVHIITPTQYCC